MHLVEAQHQIAGQDGLRGYELAHAPQLHTPVYCGDTAQLSFEFGSPA